MSRNTHWKQRERRIAKLFKTKRIGMTQGDNQPDFINDWIIGEVFVVGAKPQYLYKELSQAERAREGIHSDKLPVGIMCVKGQSDMDGIIYMKLKDFIDQFGV